VWLKIAILAKFSPKIIIYTTHSFNRPSFCTAIFLFTLLLTFKTPPPTSHFVGGVFKAMKKMKQNENKNQ